MTPRDDGARPRARLALSAGLGALGVLLYTRYAEHFARVPAARIPAALGVLGASAGVGLATGWLVAPAPYALTLRHLAAGSAAGVLASELAGSALRLGLSGTSDGFRVVWAPLVEELAKAALLAAVWAPTDERRDRAGLATLGVAVGIGFAIRENYSYFALALGDPRTYLEWVLLRALPPALAHASFGLIVGGALAHAAVHARATSAPLPRFTVAGFCVAALAHVVFNLVALVLTRVGGSYVVELTLLWSLAALGVALALRARVRALAREDEPAALSMVPSRDRGVALALGVAAALVALALVPLDATRYTALVLAPAVVGWLAALAGARALRVERTLTAVLVGMALRPVARVGEWVLLALAELLRRPSLRYVFAWLGNAPWLAVVCALTYVVARRRGPHGALAFGAAVGAGLAGSFVGQTLASAHGASLAREAALGTGLVVLRALALGGLAGWLCAGGDAKRRPVVVTFLVSALALAWDLALRLAPGGVARAALAGALGLGLYGGLVGYEARRARRAAMLAA